MYDEDRFRRYDAPSAIEGAEEEYGIEGEGALDRVKAVVLPLVGGAEPIVRQNWRLIAAGIAAIVVIYLLYSFFIGSVRSVDVFVVDTEGAAVSGAAVKIYPKGQGTALETLSGSGKVNLRLGEYEADVVASGYKGRSRSTYGFEITPDTTEQQIVLEENMDVELSIIDFPEKFFSGEVRKVTARVTNNGQQAATVGIVAEGSLKTDATVTSDTATLAPGGVADIEVGVAIKGGLDSKSGRSAIFRVRGLLRKQTFTYDVVSFDPNKVKLSRTSIDFGTANGGERIEKAFKITNNGSAEMAGIEFAVENISAQHNSEDYVQGWFSFNPGSIDSLGAGTTAARDVAVIVDVPVDAENDSIDGSIVVRTTYWQRELNIDLDVTAVSLKLSVEGLSQTYTLSKDSSGNYGPKTDPITIRNTGDISLNNIGVESDCDSQWLSISNTDIGTLAAGDRSVTVLTVKAPMTFAEGSTHTCSLRITYQDPRSPLTAPKQEVRTIIIVS